MSEFLDTLKSRLAEAQQRFQDATMAFQRAQAQHTAAAQELGSWQKAVEVESRREAVMLPPANDRAQSATDTPETAAAAIRVRADEPKPIHKNDQSSGTHDGVNQTEVVRQVVRQHPNGVTPAEVWEATQNQINSRSYVYAILGRLKDRDEVAVRRGKYYFKTTNKPESQEQENTTIQ